jgi:hypoxanthine phosphoribosyltransferase
MNQTAKAEQLRTIIPEDQIQKRIREMARQISADYQGKTVHALGLLENSFVFMADLVRALEMPLTCEFIKPKYTQDRGTPAGALEIFFSHGGDVHGRHVLMIEGLIHSGVTTEFLMGDLRARGAASVKVATLLDRQSARRVQLQPDYFGFLVDEAFMVGYGLGSAEQTHRNLPYLAVVTASTPMT